LVASGPDSETAEELKSRDQSMYATPTPATTTSHNGFPADALVRIFKGSMVVGNKAENG
jgi:hypothetical protein